MKRFALIAATLAFAPFASAGELAVTYSPDFATELTETYGEREGAKLEDYIRNDIEREFSKAGLDLARIDITILEAKPNRPTMQQVRDTPGLDMFRSVSIGGMKLQGTAYDASGNALGDLEYGWFETSLDNVGASTTWTDASRASDRFARKFVDELTG